MKNYSNKVKNALTIIRKFNMNVNVERTENENTVYLFDYSTKKKTVGSPAITKAVEKAMKQQDWPKDFVYSEGMLTLATAEMKEVTVAETQAEPEVKKSRKKKNETVIDEPIIEETEDVQAEETEDEA